MASGRTAPGSHTFYSDWEQRLLSSSRHALAQLDANAKGILLVSVPLVFEIIFVSVVAIMLFSATQEFDQMARSREALYHSTNLVHAAARNVMQIMREDVPSSQQLKVIDQSIALAQREEASSQELKVKHSELTPLLVEQHELRERLLVLLQRTRAVISNPAISFQQRKKHYDLAGGMILVMDIDQDSKRLIAIERQERAAEPEKLNDFRWMVAILLTSGVSATCVISAILARTFTLDITERLNLLAKNAHALEDGKPLLQPMQEGTDELAQLDRVLHESSAILLAARKKELAILENAAGVICSLGPDLRFQTVGAASEKVWKRSPAEFIGASLLSLVRRDTVDATRTAFLQLAEETHEGNIAIEMPMQDMSVRSFVWTVAWSKEARAYSCVVHDVTELRAIEQLKQNFVSMASHDLRTPLTSVNLGLSFLKSGKRGALPKDALDLVQNAQRSVDSLMATVNNLLELHKVEAGRLLLQKDCVSASEICLEAMEATERMAGRAGITIDGPAGDAAISGDEHKLIQVVTNLLANAVRFSPIDTTVNLSISESAGIVEIGVIDQGAPISEEQQQLIFDKFNLTRSESDNSRRSGLSLTIVKAIIESHGGTVGVESKYGSGNKFWISLPAFCEDDDS